jgi:NTP pyrophosphatase (non-canonical NTP hydrolase)
VTSNADLARRQLARHGVDRYPLVNEQYVKLVTEVGELGDELLRVGGYDVDRLRVEAADVAISLYHLCAKLGVDLDDAILELVTRDERRFDA